MVVLVAFGPVAAQASPVSVSAAGYRAASPEYGMSVFVYGNPETTARDLSKLQSLKFGWQKSLFRWRDIEGAGKGVFNWQESDRVVRASANAGLKIIARIDFQPAWARLDGANNGPPDNYQDYADFIFAFVERYKAGSPYGTVQAVEIWNEVNLDREWGGGPISQESAADYVRLLSMAYSAAKLADPSVTVIAAGLSPTGVSSYAAQPDDVFLTWLFEAGIQGNYDVLGANANVQCPCVDAWPGTVPGFGHDSFYFRRTEQLHDIMAAYGDGGKQIWLMEFGWTTDRVNPSYSGYATTEDKKADLIVQAFQFARQTWAPWIGVMTLWTVADPRWNPDDEQVWWSVTNPDGSTRPAYERVVQARVTGELP
jgi:polysaccharide biosynthesis protein PslG